MTSRKQLTGRTAEIAWLVKQTAQAILPDAEVILYGSRARGTEGPESDWDFLILTDVTITVELEESMREAMYTLSLDLAEVISAFLENRHAWMAPPVKSSPYHQAIEREGIAV